MAKIMLFDIKGLRGVQRRSSEGGAIRPLAERLWPLSATRQLKPRFQEIDNTDKAAN